MIMVHVRYADKFMDIRVRAKTAEQAIEKARRQVPAGWLRWARFVV